MIRRSEHGPLCTHCAGRNPAALLDDHSGGVVTCIHCGGSFTFYIERLPFYCTDDGRPSRCDCDVCTRKIKPTEEVEPK